MNKLKKRGLPAIICGIFYSCLCVFSIVVGLYYIVSDAAINKIELSSKMVERLKKVIHVPLEKFFGVLTFVVGIVQGISAYCLLAGKKIRCWRFSLGFTIFSLVSCSSKLLMSVNAFSIVKSFAYTFVGGSHFLNSTKDNYK